ncbi:HEAT repeat-containing protein 1, partial [Cladochytrium tenue]
MASTLARELARVRTETGVARAFGNRGGVPTILFSKEEAADQDNDAVFAVGCNGLAGLVRLDRAFAPFFEDLFSAALKATDRMLMTKKENDELSRKVEEFLIRLSPHLQQHAAPKALEWLIRRF